MTGALRYHIQCLNEEKLLGNSSDVSETFKQINVHTFSLVTPLLGFNPKEDPILQKKVCTKAFLLVYL